MKKINQATIAMAAVATIAGVATPTAVSAWGDNSGLKDGRPSLTKADAAKIDYVTFNSISDSVIGDEKNFVGARINDGTAKGKENIWNANEIEVENGKEYYVRIYAHNNHPTTEDGTGTAENVRVTFTVPSTSGTEIKVTGWIDSTNAVPTQYWDSVVFKANQTFHLEYIPGSALLENNGIGKNGGVKLPDEIISKNGTKIGFAGLDGNVPGCYTYANYVTIRVKAVYDAPYSVQKKVRLAGQTEWVEYVDAKEGDIVEYIILYKNLSDGDQNNVVVKDVLPENMEYVKGSTYLYNANHKDGIKNNDDTIATNGINIGSYAKGTNAYVIFKAKVINKSLACGTNKLVNWGQVGVEKDTQQDSAKVYVKRECAGTTPNTPAKTMPKTGPESIVAGTVAAGSITTAAGYFIASRKKLA